jgi:4-amino-4-deoxy-L-arabinose transferase-like glycosyltransferase
MNSAAQMGAGMAEARAFLRRAWAIALAFTVFRLWFVGQIDLAEDEAYYWDWSRTLALSYYEQGPMLGLAIRAATELFGTSELSVRLPAVLGALLVSGMAAWSCVHLGVARLAPWTVLAFNGMLLFAVGGVMMMHDSLLGLFWMLAIVAAMKARQDPRWWLAAGLAAGLGFLSKYNGVLLFLCLGLFALARPQERRSVGRSGWFWGGGLLGSLAAVPVLWWNWANKWPTFVHTAGLAGGDASRRGHRTVLEFVGSQFGLVTPLLMGLVVAAWIWLWRQRREASYERWLLFCASLPVAAFFLLLSLRTRIEGNWAAQAYLGGLLLVPVWLAERGPRSGRLAAWALGIALLFSGITHLQAVSPFLPFPQAHAKLDTLARVDGWRELGQRVQAERSAMGGALIGARSYQMVAVMGFYNADRPRPLLIHPGRKSQYSLWGGNEAAAGANAILVLGQAWEADEMHNYFRRLERLPDEVFRRNGNVVRQTLLYRAWGFDPSGGR